MNWIKNNIFRISILILGLAGVLLGILLSEMWYIIVGVTLGFIMVGIFVLYFDPKNKIKYKTLSIIIWSIGTFSGFLTGYRNSVLPPWRWKSHLEHAFVVIDPYIELTTALIPWTVSLVLGLTIWILGMRKKRVSGN